ncbi:hypothetical protein [Rhodothermus profundi]|uniref:ABC-2 family transporter protein n=1 Tax=Rhodothermus profundi TaxID=633813 RepID=A0A1M6T114_9BACT|nr:hypothetical protein [Rhodothermus profundi]SHK50609.1 hypothetical protein SAMN04488087_1314 [Rhodothermus profundi]
MQAILWLFARSFLRQWILWFFVGLAVLLTVLTHQGRLLPSARLITTGLSFVLFISLTLIQSFSAWLRPSWLTLVLVRPRPRWQLFLTLLGAAALAVGLVGLTLWAPGGPSLPIALLLTTSFGFALAAWLLMGLLLLPSPLLLALLAILYTFTHSWLSVYAIQGDLTSQLLDTLLPSAMRLFLQMQRVVPWETTLRFCLEELGTGLLIALLIGLLMRHRDIAHLAEEPEALG